MSQAAAPQPPDLAAEHALDIEWYRPDPWRRLLPRWLLGAGLMIAGLLCTAAGYLRLRHGDAPGPLALLVGGLLCVTVGLLVFVRNALRVLADDTCIGLRVDGVLHREGGDEGRLVPWSAIEAIACDASGSAVIVKTNDGELRLLVRGLDISSATLAERIRTLRQRALMGLPLRP
ncbi:MAG: hypothetical protein KC620_04945 [Myxococcales bacterium]|nr:hypothetical protein [Myxococcales bacterium]